MPLSISSDNAPIYSTVQKHKKGSEVGEMGSKKTKQTYTPPNVSTVIRECESALEVRQKCLAYSDAAYSDKQKCTKRDDGSLTLPNNTKQDEPIHTNHNTLSGINGSGNEAIYDEPWNSNAVMNDFKSRTKGIVEEEDIFVTRDSLSEIDDAGEEPIYNEPADSNADWKDLEGFFANRIVEEENIFENHNSLYGPDSSRHINNLPQDKSTGSDNRSFTAKMRNSINNFLNFFKNLVVKSQ